MEIKLEMGALGQSKWYEYVLRFAFGGTVTALAGIIAKRFGPEIGGLFLAFTAILPASATLIEKHERQKKERNGMQGAERGRKAAGVDAIGASMGAIGLAAFALVVWRRLPESGTGMVLAGATVAWLLTSVSIWKTREVLCRRVRRMGASNHRSASAQLHEPSIKGRRDEQERAEK